MVIGTITAGLCTSTREPMCALYAISMEDSTKRLTHTREKNELAAPSAIMTRIEKH